VHLAPGSFEAHANLGAVLRARGELRASLASVRRAADLARRRPPAGADPDAWVCEAERLVERGDTLGAVLACVRPATPEALCEYAEVCVARGLHADAARLYAAAFAVAPALVEEDGDDAARAAVLAAGRATGDDVRVRLRGQAEVWLSGALAGADRVAAEDRPDRRQAAVASLRRWQKDRELAAVRDADALGGLPADERRRWEGLWARVAVVIREHGDR
jgi:hypothetical protein